MQQKKFSEADVGKVFKTRGGGSMEVLEVDADVGYPVVCRAENGLKYYYKIDGMRDTEGQESPLDLMEHNRS